MAVYRAFVINDVGKVASFLTFNCYSDADATTWAEEISDGRNIELWMGERFVVRLDSEKQHET